MRLPLTPFSWKLLIARVGSWRSKAADQSTRVAMTAVCLPGAWGVPGDSWGFLGVPGGSREFLGVLGAGSWGFLGLPKERRSKGPK